MMPETMMAAMPMKYASGATHHTPPKMAVAMRAMIGNLAEQGMKVVVMTVMRRVLSFSMVWVAMMPARRSRCR